jgi:hypothetical protein
MQLGAFERDTALLFCSVLRARTQKRDECLQVRVCNGIGPSAFDHKDYVRPHRQHLISHKLETETKTTKH